MEILALALISAAAIYMMARHMRSAFNEGEPCHGCGGCSAKCPAADKK